MPKPCPHLSSGDEPECTKTLGKPELPRILGRSSSPETRANPKHTLVRAIIASGVTVAAKRGEYPVTNRPEYMTATPPRHRAARLALAMVPPTDGASWKRRLFGKFHWLKPLVRSSGGRRLADGPGGPIPAAITKFAQRMVQAVLALIVTSGIVPLVEAANETWTMTGSMSMSRDGHTATLLQSGKVLVVGGSGEIFHASSELYDPATGSWAMLGSMSVARIEHTATLLPNGKVLVAGGRNIVNGWNAFSSAELYDPASGTWTLTGAMSAARFNHTATLLPNGRVLVAGGGRLGSSYHSSAELYDPATGTWSMTGSMSIERQIHTATLLSDGKVLVAGGYGYAYLTSVELYDPTTGTWAMTGSMSYENLENTATLLPNGKVLVAGGYGYGGGLARAQLYNPATGTWTSTGSMESLRRNHTANLLQSGKVVVVGGYNYDGVSSNYSSSAELYDPTTQTWTAAGAMSISRGYHTATLLPNGSVLVAGGGPGSSSRSAELYWPERYTVTLGPSLHGSITGNVSPYFPNTTATLTATPGSGCVFTGWGGDATGSSNPLSVLMDSNKTITANFAPDTSDTDGDNLTAYDELAFYGTDPTKSDTDGDGLSDAWEAGRGRFSVVAGTFTWAQARADAQSKGGDLASFPDENRWNRAMETLGANALDDFTGLWLGASDAAAEGTWTWVNGETFSFSQWAGGRPSSTVGNTLDYAEVSGGGGTEIGRWYDRSPGTVREGYILETGYATNPTVADADGDGLNDSAEQTAGTNPFVADTDGDGLTDGQEVNLTHSNPKLADTDGDGLDDAADDQDGDGLTNLAEITQHGTDPLKTDTDGDGLTDGAEINHPASFFSPASGSFTYSQAAADAAVKRGRVASFPIAADFTRMAAKARQTTQGFLWIGLTDAATEGTWLWNDGTTASYQRWLAGQPDGNTAESQAIVMENSTQWADADATFTAAGYLLEHMGLEPLVPDTDGDGLVDGQELNTVHSNPVIDDTDGDGLDDGAEVNTHHSSPLLADTDGDGLNDRVEVGVYHSNPSLKDTDEDGFDDLFEVNTGFDPTHGASTPDAQSSIRSAVEFRFNAATGVSYRIEGSTDLSEWSTIEPAINGQGGVVTRFYSTENQPKRYFRVRRN